MFDLKKRQYIFRLSSGRTINLFYKENTGLCLSVLNKRNVWFAPAVVMKNTLPRFSACLDRDEQIHILCQDKNGLPSYLLYQQDQWKTTPLTGGRNALPGNRHVWIGCAGQQVCLFYILEYPDSRFLYFHTRLSREELSEPYILDYVDVTENPYTVIRDPSDCLCIFYRQKDLSATRWGYRIYYSNTGTWSDFLPLKCESPEEEVRILAACADRNNNLHILQQKNRFGKHTLVCSVLHRGETHWHHESVLTSGSIPVPDASLAIINDKLIAYWVRDGAVHYRESVDDGRTWSTPLTYVFKEEKMLYCIAYSSGELLNSSHTYINELPGTFADGYKLAFLSEAAYMKPSDSTSTEAGITGIPLPGVSAPGAAAPETQETASRPIHATQEPPPCSCSGKIEELKQAVKSSDDRISELERQWNQLLGDLENLNAKHTLIETGLAKLRSELETFSKPKPGPVPSVAATQPRAQTTAQPTAQTTAQPAAQRNPAPGSPSLMPGTGFSGITPEFLKSLKK